MNWHELTFLQAAIVLTALMLDGRHHPGVCSSACAGRPCRSSRGPGSDRRAGGGLVATYNIATNQPVLFDAAIVLALMAFLGTVAFCAVLGTERP